MKKNTAAILALVLVLSLLSGCANATKTYTCGEITMDVPSYMSDVSGQSAYAAYTFTLDSAKLAIFGLQESLADYPVLADYTLADYTDLVILGNGLSATANTRSGHDYMYFLYESETAQGTYKYLAATFESDEGFWLIQIASPITAYDEAAFFGYLDSVRVS